MSKNMLPSTSARSITVNGRSYTAVAGTPINNVPDQDAAVMSANGWIDTAGTNSQGSGTTAQRPTTGLKSGHSYHDTTLGYVIVYDGNTWRHQSTGAAV